MVQRWVISLSVRQLAGEDQGHRAGSHHRSADVIGRGRVLERCSKGTDSGHARPIAPASLTEP